MKLINNLDKVQELITFQHKNPSFCEKLLASIYGSILKPGDNFIDVGARVGHHLFPMARLVKATGEGLGIEANQDVASGLVDRIENDINFKDSLTIVSAAATDHSGVAKFFIRKDFQGWSSLYESHVHPSETAEVQEEDVKLVKIDNIVLDDLGWDKCKFIKLDIENAEFMALKGAKETIEKLQPCLAFENSPRNAANLNGYSVHEFLSFFDSLDYKLLDIYMNEVTIERLDSNDVLPSYYFACPNSFNLGSFLESYNNSCSRILNEMSN